MGVHDSLIDPSKGTSVVATSLADLPSPAIAWVEPGVYTDLPRVYQISAVANLYFELVQGATNASGPVNYYHNPTGTNTLSRVGTSTWAMTTVNGVELLMVDHPDVLMSQFSMIAPEIDSPEENNFFVVQDFVVRQGNHMPANIVETTAESILTNQQAQNEITGAFLDAPIINATPSAELACDTDSDWNPLIDKPVITYSFADFESVVTTCGGALPVDASTLADDGNGINRSYSMSDGTRITFNLDNTGSYSMNAELVRNFTFNWAIDSTTNHITLENIDNSSRDILAVIAIDLTTLPATITLKSYVEKIGSSDMVTDLGSDGQIMHLAPYPY